LIAAIITRGEILAALTPFVRVTDYLLMTSNYGEESWTWITFTWPRSQRRYSL